MVSISGPLGVPPSAPSLHARDACFWVGVPPLSSPPLRPLVLGAHDRSRGGISSVSPSAIARSACARLGGFVPPLPPLCILVVSCVPMAVLLRCRPRSVLASHQRRCCRFAVLTTLARVAFGFGCGCAGEVCWRVPCAASFLRRLLHSVLHRCRASWRRAVPAIRRLLPGVSGSGWVFVPSPPRPSVLPPSGLGRCGVSQGFVSPGSPIFSGGRVVP